MNHRKKIYSGLVFLVAVASILGGMIAHAKDDSLKVVFLDVGQGDAILIEQGEKQILIDGGPSGKRLMEELGKYVPFWDRKIDVVIATHPDSDHISGLVDVLKNYEVGEMIKTDAKSGTDVDKSLLGLVSDKKIESQLAEKGLAVKLSDEARLDIIAPRADENVSGEKDTNSGSVVAMLIYGKNKFLFMGDFPIEKDPELIADNQDLGAQFLKVSHHGSKNATSEEFLKAVKPETAIISVGKGNRYGHPAQEALERLKNAGSEILRTDERGDVVFECQDSKRECAVN
ncbi:MAG: MBL fold metallo-hydrolase [Candidatus Moranbacteria bacterium]|nr:MBL fold metallo-hydrolase [Candidatus Moranbacteria bacterium]